MSEERKKEVLDQEKDLEVDENALNEATGGSAVNMVRAYAMCTSCWKDIYCKRQRELTDYMDANGGFTDRSQCPWYDC